MGGVGQGLILMFSRLIDYYLKDGIAKTRIAELNQRIDIASRNLTKSYKEARDMAEGEIPLDYSKAQNQVLNAGDETCGIA